MSNAAYKMEQINYLDTLFSSGKRYKPEELAELLYKLNSDGKGGTSIKTVYRLLKEMKEDFHAPIVKDEENRRYYSCDKTVMLPSFVARAENFHFVKIVNNLLETIKDTPIYEKAEKVFKELSICAPNKSSLTDVSAPSRVIFLGAPASDIKSEVYNTILNGMEMNKHLIIYYYNYKKKIVEKKGVQPYQLIYDKGIWDLWCYDCLSKERRQYNVSRIRNVEIVNEPFTLPKDYDYHNETPGTFGCYRDVGKKDHYSILFKRDSYAYIYAKDRVWGLNQTTDESRDDGIVISFDNNQSKLIERWVLALTLKHKMGNVV